MTNLTANLQDTVNNALQEVLNTNSKKSSILLWNNLNLPNSFILKKDGKKYLGLPRKDKKGGDYWKFKEIRGKKKSDNSKEYANDSHTSKE
jgi:hypothetical protein